MEDNYLKCSDCGITKHISDFVEVDTARGYTSRCNTCACRSRLESGDKFSAYGIKQPWNELGLTRNDL